MNQVIIFSLFLSLNCFAMSEQVDRNMFMREYHQEKREEQKKKKKAKKVEYKQKPGNKYQPKKKKHRVN